MLSKSLFLVFVIYLSNYQCHAYSSGQDQIDWLLTKPNAFFSNKIAWKRLDENNNDNSGMMMAVQDIKKNETLMVIPRSALITGNGANCQTVATLIEEYEKGKESEYFPYVDYLLNDETKRSILPSAWSKQGKRLLKRLLGRDLMPFDPFLHQVQSSVGCRNIVQDLKNPTPLEQFAYRLMISRSWDDVMIPVYDMVNHRNGKWRNVEATSAHTDQDVVVFAYRNIKAGEQLYMSYSDCNDVDCAGLKDTYSTQLIVGDYGFIEDYPRRWTIAIDDYDDLMAEIDIDEETSEVFLTWPLKGLPDLYQLNWIRAHLKRLREFDTVVAEEALKLESEHERKVITELHRGYKELFELAIAYREDDLNKNTTASSEYDPLVEPKGPAVEGMNVGVCMHNPTDRDYDTYNETESQYQTIAFTYNENDDNTCLQLSGWYQTCSNFRPHYHEAFVHVPAQYAEDVRRVIFLGGGDNMILHEILKYPNLELVIGMELDQQVIRSSYKHLGTLPYFDDPRVQWWFGDATKSLFALPESYFGSFDLVLVDLQTFVADALKVNDRLSIMDTAILLMKQDGGVIAKNEDFSVRTNVGFAKYTVDLEYHDLPFICQQSITMGSNSIDFMKTKPKNHGVETFAIDLVDFANVSSDTDPFHAWYSYRQTIPESCNEKDMSESNMESENSDEVPQANQVGVFVAFEAENLTIAMDISYVQSRISKAVESLGLNEKAVSSSPEFDQNVFVIILNEGYVAARVFAQQKYISFDLKLWDSLDRVDAVREGLILALGGSLQASSSFRFVSGGMSGLDSCQKDVLFQIANYTQQSTCRGIHNEVAIAQLDEKAQAIMKTVLQELVVSMNPSPNSDESPTVLAVLCGHTNSKCSSLEDIAVFDSLKKSVFPVHTCESFSDMAVCQEQTKKEFLDIAAQGKKVDILVLDSNLPFFMGQIVEKIFSNKVTHNKVMQDSHLILSPVPKDESWRTVLLDQFRTDIFLFDPAHRANLRFMNDSGDDDAVTFLQWCLFSSGDDHFFNHLSTALSSIETKTGMKSEAKEVTNGIVNMIANFYPSKVFKDSDYDKTRALSQWSSQTPIGHQTIFQMIVKPPKTPLMKNEKVLAQYTPGPWDLIYGPAIIRKTFDDDTYLVSYTDLDSYEEGDHEPVGLERHQIRKFSDADHDMTTIFAVGDLILYKNERGLYTNGVISKVEDDDKYSIYLLNTSGTKLYGVPRSQLLFQFESSDFVQEIPKLSIPKVLGAFGYALKHCLLEDDEEMSLMNHYPVGDGVIITAFWRYGHAILQWDGQNRVDVNMFTYEEDIESRLEFLEYFLSQIDYMESLARDEHPRGFGRVVNFASEIASPPHWVVKSTSTTSTQ